MEFNGSGTLTKKVGPFPVWVYGIVGGLGIGLYLRHRNAANAAAAAPTVVGDTTGGTGTALDANGNPNGATAFGTAGVGGQAPPIITVNIEQPQNPITGGGGDTPAGSGGRLVVDPNPNPWVGMPGGNPQPVSAYTPPAYVDPVPQVYVPPPVAPSPVPTAYPPQTPGQIASGNLPATVIAADAAHSTKSVKGKPGNSGIHAN